MSNHQENYQPNGIYTVLNQFYKKHESDYDFDPNGENLKNTVLKN